MRIFDDLFQLPAIVDGIERPVCFWGEEGIVDVRELVIRDNVCEDAVRGICQDDELRESTEGDGITVGSGLVGTSVFEIGVAKDEQDADKTTNRLVLSRVEGQRLETSSAHFIQVSDLGDA